MLSKKVLFLALFFALILTASAASANQSISVYQPMSGGSIHPKDLVPTAALRSISATGSISTGPIDINELPSDKPQSVYVDVSSPLGNYSETMQLYPASDVIISQAGDRIMQVRHGDNQPVLEIYYGYNQDGYPWEQYYRVTRINGICLAVRSTFADKTVTVSEVNPDDVQSVIDSPVIVEYGDLP